MKKIYLLLIILSIFIIRCSEEISNESRQVQINSEFTNDNQTQEEADYFSYESESKTNIIKTKTAVKENKPTEIKTNELKNIWKRLKKQKKRSNSCSLM